MFKSRWKGKDKHTGAVHRGEKKKMKTATILMQRLIKTSRTRDIKAKTVTKCFYLLFWENGTFALNHQKQSLWELWEKEMGDFI